MRAHTSALVTLLIASASALAAPAGAQSSSGYRAAMPDDQMLAPVTTVSDLTNANPYAPWYPGGAPPSNPPAGINNPIYQAPAGGAYDGVARLLIQKSDGSYGCTGSLLWGGRDILTAAHCVYDANTGMDLTGNAVLATFLRDDGGNTSLVDYASSEIYVNPFYTGSTVDPNDVAVIHLSAPAAPWIPRYDLFTGNPLFEQVDVVGFGLTGNGVTGGIIADQFNDFLGYGLPVRRKAENSWELTMTPGGASVFADYVPDTPILLSDFDGADPGGTYPIRGGNWPSSTLEQNNTFCRIFDGVPMPADLHANICSTGYGIFEGAIDSGDSGGPGFINVNGTLMIAGVASFEAQRCVPIQSRDLNVLLSNSCNGHLGETANGSFFGSYAGHVAVGFGDNYAFIRSHVTPEPASLLLLGLGLVGLTGVRRRGRKRDEGEETASA